MTLLTFSVEEPERPAGDDVITGLEQLHHRGDGGHAGGGRLAIDAAFERGEVLFESLARGVDDRV